MSIQTETGYKDCTPFDRHEWVMFGDGRKCLRCGVTQYGSPTKQKPCQTSASKKRATFAHNPLNTIYLSVRVPVLRRRTDAKLPALPGDIEAREEILEALLAQGFEVVSTGEGKYADAWVRWKQIPCHITRPATKIATAYRDAEGWVLFDPAGNVVEKIPDAWPKSVTVEFLKDHGIRVA